MTGKIIYTGPLVAPVEADKQVARLKISRGTSVILDIPLRTGESVAQGSLQRRAMDAGLEYRPSCFATTLRKMSLTQPGGRGSFITLEGGKGVGKSTQLRMIVEKLRALQIDAIATREPWLARCRNIA